MSEIESISVDGTPFGGTYTVVVCGRRSPPIPYESGPAPAQAMLSQKSDAVVALTIMGEELSLVRWSW